MCIRDREIAGEDVRVAAAAVEVVAAEEHVVVLVLQDLEGHAVHAAEAALRIAFIPEALAGTSRIHTPLVVGETDVPHDHPHMFVAVRVVRPGLFRLPWFHATPP